MAHATVRHRKRKSLLAVPAAVATATSVIFGLHAGLVDDVPESSPEGPTPAPRDPVFGSAYAGPRSGSVNSAAKVFEREKDGTYIVRSGDTLLDIAGGFRVSSVDLLASNGLSWRTLLVVGQRLTIPHTTSGTAEHDRIDTVTRHHVIAGETLEHIARSHGIQPRALMSANGLSRTSRLIVGQRLLIPNAQVMGGLEALA